MKAEIKQEIRRLMDATVWDGFDYVGTLYNLVLPPLTKENILYRNFADRVLHEWLVTTIGTALDCTDYLIDKCCLVLCGKQGTGKSLLLEKLSIKPEWFDSDGNGDGFICELNNEYDLSFDPIQRLYEKAANSWNDTAFAYSTNTHSIRDTPCVCTMPLAVINCDMDAKQIVNTCSEDFVLQLWKQVAFEVFGWPNASAHKGEKDKYDSLLEAVQELDAAAKKAIRQMNFRA